MFRDDSLMDDPFQSNGYVQIENMERSISDILRQKFAYGLEE